MIHFRSFRSRLLCYFIGLFAIILLCVYAAAFLLFRQNTIQTIHEQLTVAERVFLQLLHTRNEQLSKWATILSSDFAFKEVINTFDRATIVSALENLAQRIGTDYVILLSVDRHVIADIRDSDASGSLFFAPSMLVQAEATGSSSALQMVDSIPYQLIIVPVLAPEPIAWLCVGFKLDQTFIDRLKALTQMEISILTSSSRVAKVSVSTLKEWSVLPDDWQKLYKQPSFFLGAENNLYLSRIVILQENKSDYTFALIQRSWRREMENFYQLSAWLATISLLGLGVIALTGSWLSKTVSAPLLLLAESARAIGLGKYHQCVQIKTSDEIGELSTTFNEMALQLVEKEKMRNLLGKVVSPVVATELLAKELVLGGETREISVLFSDLAGFTSISETLSPVLLVTMLNEYLSQMSSEINICNGVIDKFIGDAILAFWGAPVVDLQHPYHAVQTALAMQRALTQLHTHWKVRNYPAMAMRIGINSGSAIVGNIGSADRMDYTIIGDTVNLAERLESANKFYRTRILISESTYRDVQNSFLCRELDLILVHGKQVPVRVYEVITEMKQLVLSDERLTSLFEQALLAFRQRNWQHAERLFHDILEEHPKDGPSQLYLKRLQQNKTYPPDDNWQGIHVLDKHDK